MSSTSARTTWTRYASTFTTSSSRELKSASSRTQIEDLGFTPGGTATVVAAMGGNIIVKIKESRVAISEEMARKIMI